MVNKDYRTRVVFDTNICDGGRITIPMQDLNLLGIEENDRLRINIKTAYGNEDSFLVKVGSAGRFTVPIAYRESMNIVLGDPLNVIVQLDDRPFVPIKGATPPEYTDYFPSVIEGGEIILPPRFDEWEGHAVKVMLRVLDQKEAKTEAIEIDTV